MIKYTVKRNGIIISEYNSDFADENYYEENWGPKQQVIQHPEIPAIPDTEIIPAEFDSQGVEISPMIPAIKGTSKVDAYEEVIAGYTIEITDITAELEQAAINKEAHQYLASTDYKVLRHLRQGALGVVTTLSNEEYLQLEISRDEASKRIV